MKPGLLAARIKSAIGNWKSAMTSLPPLASNELLSGAARLLRLETLLYVGVCGMDELPHSRLINLLVGPEFYMPHELATAFQQTVCIGEFGATKEPDVHVILERIDVTECRIPDTGRWMTIMQ